MTRKELAYFLAGRLQQEIPLCESFLTEMFAAIARALAKGEPVTLAGFGDFRVEGEGEKCFVAFKPNNVLLGFVSGTPGQRKVMKAHESGEWEASRAVDVERAALPEVVPGESGRLEAIGRSLEIGAEAEGKTELSELAEDLLGLDREELERGLAVDRGASLAAQHGPITFPVKVSHQMRSEAQRAFRPADGDERRSFKALTLRNFFLSLGSVVRDRRTHEPMIVFDAADRADRDGERYTPRLLRVAGGPPSAPAGPAAPSGATHNLRFEALDFDCERHEVLMVLDPQQGPRPHCFDIGNFQSNDRRQLAEVCLAQEYERYMAAKKRT